MRPMIFLTATFTPEKTQAAAHFASTNELKRGGLFGRRGIRIGFSSDGKVLRYAGAGHLLLVAAARTGMRPSAASPILSNRNS